MCCVCTHFLLLLCFLMFCISLLKIYFQFHVVFYLSRLHYHLASNVCIVFAIDDCHVCERNTRNQLITRIVVFLELFSLVNKTNSPPEWASSTTWFASEPPRTWWASSRRCSCSSEDSIWSRTASSRATTREWVFSYITSNLHNLCLGNAKQTAHSPSLTFFQFPRRNSGRTSRDNTNRMDRPPRK